MLQLTVRTERSGPIRGRHPWVFSGALHQIPDGIPHGEPVELVDERGIFLAAGYFNSYSQIAVRLWSFAPVKEITTEFFAEKIRTAAAIRTQWLQSDTTNAYRLIHGENDGLPGLIVDRYADYLVVQFHTPGMARWKKEIIAALVSAENPRGIFERSDVGRRTAVHASEESVTGVLYGEVANDIEIRENGLRFAVNVHEGQKTGFFLDQRDKRQALQKYVAGKTVLNCFSYTGGFSVYARAASAIRVTSVDASQHALQYAEKNMALNGFADEASRYEVADVKDYLSELITTTHATPHPYDVIILDPPAFVKDRRKIKEGLVGYRAINEQALRLLPPGGILVTASCSAHVTLHDFRFMLSEAAARAKRSVRILETYTHGIDHPETAAFVEGDYLKCFFVLVD